MSSPAAKRRRQTIGQEFDDVRIDELSPLLPPACLLEELPLNESAAATVRTGRRAVEAIVQGNDDRLLVIIGPCSIHDTDACLEYAKRLKKLADGLAADLYVVMRVYFEKPRTTVGWKGLINDPALDGSFQINRGLREARKFLLDINSLGLPTGCEFLDTISPQFIGDLVSWGAIGARTTESQIHRELASGLSCSIGFKNGTAGDVQVAVDACGSASKPHAFLSVTKQGLAAIVHTKGNPNCHVILRGGKSGPNYDADAVKAAQATMLKSFGSDRLMIDCSHGNSRKIHTNQPIVAKAIGDQLAAGNKSIMGVMIESHLNEGNQKLSPGVTDLTTLKRGVSVTDACIDFASTEAVLKSLAEDVRKRRAAA